jgi:hypothetical protein
MGWQHFGQFITTNNSQVEFKFPCPYGCGKMVEGGFSFKGKLNGTGGQQFSGNANCSCSEKGIDVDIRFPSNGSGEVQVPELRDQSAVQARGL